MSKTIFFSMPLSINYQKNKSTIKKSSINLNIYRNLNKWDEAKIKKAYQDIACKKLKEYRFSNFDKIEIYFVLYKGSKRKIDRSNFLSIHEKYFCDALTSMQVIPDDNDSHIESTHYYSSHDKHDPRVEIFITVLDHNEHE